MRLKMKIVLSGKMKMNRVKETKRFKEYGIQIQSGVNSKTDYLVIGEDPGYSKTSMAGRFSTKILTETEFMDMLVDEFPEYLI